MQLLFSISIMVQPGIAALSRIGELLKLKTEEEVSGDKKQGESKILSVLMFLLHIQKGLLSAILI